MNVHERCERQVKRIPSHAWVQSGIRQQWTHRVTNEFSRGFQKRASLFCRFPCVKIHSPGVVTVSLPPRGVASFHYAFLTIVAVPRRAAPRNRVLLKQVISMNYCNALVLPTPSVRFRDPPRVYATFPGGGTRLGAVTGRRDVLWILRGSTCQALTCLNYRSFAG